MKAVFTPIEMLLSSTYNLAGYDFIAWKVWSNSLIAESEVFNDCVVIAKFVPSYEENSYYYS